MNKNKSERPWWAAIRFRPAAMIAFFWVAACSDATEHMLNPAGPAAARIERIWWEMFVVYGSIYIITLVLLFFALVVRRRDRTPLGYRFVFISGIAIPTVILVIMLVIAIHDTMEMGKGQAEFKVKVISRHWWFEVHYPELGIVEANEINIPAGVRTHFELQSKGVVHSFWVPRLGGKRDMLPDHPTHLMLKADKAGDYRGSCAEYCAGPHALMTFRLIAHEKEDFERWARERSGPPPEPTEPELIRGRQVFAQEGCIACHAIRGVSEANAGPDLTLIGSRRTLGAGTIAHTRGSLTGWIANPQEIKPGNMMPRSYLAPDDLHALTAYLRSLQ